MTAADACARLAAARVARLATAGADGRPHLVPVCFAVVADRAWTAVDHKPKATTALRRLRNVAQNPAVALLADHYDDADWTALWWARADGRARMLDPADPAAAAGVDAIVARYAQYAERRPTGPVVEITVTRWSGWSAAAE